MASEDALFRVMVPVAERLFDNQQRKHGTVDAGHVADETLEQFAQTVTLDGIGDDLRARLVAHLSARSVP